MLNYLKNRVYFSHFENRLTVAFTIDGNLVRYGFAWCSLKDTFNKKIGRTIAEGRLKKLGFEEIISNDVERIPQVGVKVLKSILRCGLYPSWVEKIDDFADDFYEIDEGRSIQELEEIDFMYVDDNDMEIER